MRLERLLRSKFWRSAIVTDAYDTLEITQPEGDMRETRGIQITVHGYPKPKDRSPHQSVLLPPNDAFEVARNIVRVHHGVASDKRDVDLVGFHAMSETEYLMVEAVMNFKDPDLRLAFWHAMGSPQKAVILMEHFVSAPKFFEDLARGELGMKASSEMSDGGTHCD